MAAIVKEHRYAILMGMAGAGAAMGALSFLLPDTASQQNFGPMQLDPRGRDLMMTIGAMSGVYSGAYCALALAEDKTLQHALGVTEVALTALAVRAIVSDSSAVKPSLAYTRLVIHGAMAGVLLLL